MTAVKREDQPDIMSVTEFLVWSQQQEGKWELHDGTPVRLHSERASHARVKNKILRNLEEAIKTSRLDCEAMPDGMTVLIDEATSYEPDALVYCGDPIDGNELTVPNPVIIVEVLSPSTAYKDVSTKLIDYFKLPSLMHYLVLDPASKQIQHHFRKDGNKASPVRMNAIFADQVQLDPPGLVLELGGVWG